MNAAAGEARRFPWDDVIALGLGLLRLAPRDFWSATPREMAHALRIHGAGHGIGGAASPPERQSVEALMALFPDDQGRTME